MHQSQMLDIDLFCMICRVATGVNISTNVSIYRLRLKLVDPFVDNIDTLYQPIYRRLGVKRMEYFEKSIDIKGFNAVP